MWVVKTKGKTYYVNHVTCNLPWTTKETPDNSHTKGSIKIKKCLLIINEDNEAEIKELTTIDAIRIRNQEKGIVRVIVKEGPDYWKFQEQLKNLKIKHGPIKSIGGACSSRFYITDIIDQRQFTMLALSMSNTTFRILMPNEGYYKMYDDPKYQTTSDIDEDEYSWDDEDE